MLQAWRDASKHCRPPPRIPQTLIVGTEDARASLSPSFSGLFRRSQSALTCDLAILRLMKLQPPCRYVAVVQDACQLRDIIESAHTPDSSNFVIAVVGTNQEILCATRIEALRAGGLGLVAGGRSLHVVQAVLEAWVGREHVDNGALKKAFGSACLGKDVVIPPAWDSEAKIRAVTDALDVNYDVLSQTTNALNNSALRSSPDQGRERKTDSQVKRDFLQQNQIWLTELADKLHAQSRDGNVLPEAKVEDVTRASRAEHASVQSDFFQRLLSERKP